MYAWLVLADTRWPLEYICYLHFGFSHWPASDVIVSFTVNRITLKASYFSVNCLNGPETNEMKSKLMPA